MFIQKKNLHSAFLLGLLTLVVPSVASAADISPYLDMETIAVVRVNLKQLDLPGIQKYVEESLAKAVDEVIPKNEPNLAMIKMSIQAMSGGNPSTQIYDEAVVKSGAEELYLIAYRDAMMAKMFPVLLAVPVPEGASQEAIDTIRMQYLQNGIPVTFVRHGFIVGIPVVPNFSSQKKIMEFAREKFKNPSTQSRPEIVEAISSQPTALLQVVVGKIDQFQKDVEKQINAFKPMLMMMPKEQKAPIEEALKMVPFIFQGLSSYNFAYDYGKPEIKTEIKLKDKQTADGIAALIPQWKKQNEDAIDKMATLNHISEKNSMNPGMTAKEKEIVRKFIASVQDKQQGNTITFLIDSSGMESLKALVYEIQIKGIVHGAYTGIKIGESIRESQGR